MNKIFLDMGVSKVWTAKEKIVTFTKTRDSHPAPSPLARIVCSFDSPLQGLQNRQRMDMMDSEQGKHPRRKPNFYPLTLSFETWLRNFFFLTVR